MSSRVTPQINSAAALKWLTRRSLSMMTTASLACSSAASRNSEVSTVGRSEARII